MFKNYLKVAVRSLIRHKFYSIINISGLAIGIMACLLILLFVQDELSYDKFYDQSDQIYRVTQVLPMGAKVSHTATAPWPLTQTLLTDFPEILAGAKIHRPSSWGNVPVIKYEDQSYLEEDWIFADASILDIFNFNFTKGAPERALKSPLHVVITESTARKYFGNDDPIGKTLNYNNNRDWEVAAVIEDVPQNSHLKFDFIASFEGMRQMWNNWPGFDNNWRWVAAWSYLLLPDDATAERMQEQLPAFVERHYSARNQQAGLKLAMQKILDVHLYSELEAEFKPNSDITYVYLFTSIAVLILLIACINFMNLATSRAAGRAKEVGLRKVVGADRFTLIIQFLSEAIWLSFVSLMLALILIHLVLPWFNDLTGKSLGINYFDNWVLVVGLVMIGLAVGVLAGSYPAFFLSAFSPTEVLQGKVSGGLGSSILRRVLVIGQFVVSIVLLICIGIVYNQLHYMRNKDLGFDKEQMVLVNMYGNIFNQYGAFKSELLKDSRIRGVTRIGGSIPGYDTEFEHAFVPEGFPPDEHQWLGVMWVSHDMEEVLGVELATGRSLQVGSSSDSTFGFILNETAARFLGWQDNAVGKRIDHIGGQGNVTRGEVIGVVKDFHFRPLHEPLKPLVLREGGNRLAIKVASMDIPGTLALIERTWKQFEPDWPFSHQFMDENIDQLYLKEQKFSQIIQYFALLAVFIACLGLLGLASFTTERRRKEISVRKVMGATTTGLLLLLSKEFSKLVLIAFAIAVPIGYFAGERWLQDFAFRVDISMTVFVLAGIIALAIALASVSYHTVKAAMVNPAENLKYE